MPQVLRTFIPSWTKIVELLVVVVPVAALVLANFDAAAARVLLVSASAIVAYGVLSVLIRDGGAPTLPDNNLVRVTLGNVLLGLLAAAVLGVALCYWPEQPPGQKHGSDWVDLGTMPTMLVLLSAHPFETLLYLLLVGYTSAAALLAMRKVKTNVPPRFEHARRYAPVVLAVNVLMLVVALVGFSRTPADRIWSVKSKALVRE